MAICRSTTIGPNDRSGGSRSDATTGRFSAAIRAERLRPSCAPLSPPANSSRSIRLPGSGMYWRESRTTRSPGSTNSCLTTGRLPTPNLPSIPSLSESGEVVRVGIHRMLTEDPHLLAVNKPSGLPTLPGSGFMENTLLRLVQKHIANANPVHRLGRATSGIVLFAKTQQVASNLSANWNTPKVQKIYRALAQNIAQHDAYEILT